MARKKASKRKLKDLLPITLSMRECERRGWKVAQSETVFPGTFIRKDAFGLADCIAVGTGGPGTLYIQATSRSNHSARRNKALASENLRPLLEDGNRFVIWSWVRTRGAENLKEEEIFLGQLEEGSNEDAVVNSKGVTRQFPKEDMWSLEMMR